MAGQIFPMIMNDVASKGRGRGGKREGGKGGLKPCECFSGRLGQKGPSKRREIFGAGSSPAVDAREAWPDSAPAQNGSAPLRAQEPVCSLIPTGSHADNCKAFRAVICGSAYKQRSACTRGSLHNNNTCNRSCVAFRMSDENTRWRAAPKLLQLLPGSVTPPAWQPWRGPGSRWTKAQRKTRRGRPGEAGNNTKQH